nr:hypothetical protein [Tanacetum cinerariifolium]
MQACLQIPLTGAMLMVIFVFFDCIDIDEFPVLEVSGMVNKLGYSDKVTMFYHFKKPGCDLDNGLHTLRNDSDVLALGEYVRLGNRVTEVYVEHHTSTLDTYYQSQHVTEISTPKNSCIIEAPDDIIPAKRPNKFPPKKCGKSAYARNLLGWNEIRDKLGVGQSSQVTEVDQSSQSNPTPIVQPSAFVDDFYVVDDPFNGQGDFEPLFRLDDITPLVNVDGTVKGERKAIKVDVGDKGKEVEVNMDSFDRTNADNMGYEQNPMEFNANDEIEVDMDVMDPDEFESASDEDGLERIRNKKLKQLGKQGKTKDGYVPNIVFFVGKEFATADDVKKDIHKLSIETRRKLFLKKNDKVRVRAECRGTIPVFEDTPQHGPSDGGPSQASGAKSKAVDSVRGDYTLQYKMLRDYVLKECNPNITVKIGVETEEDHTSPTRIFKRIYMCLDASKAGFKACRREFLGLDEAFMKGPFPGQLLTAVGINPNNGIYPLTYGIVEIESRESWTWFLECLKDDLDLQDNSNLTFITDRQKGIIPAIAKLFPATEHRFCLRYIHENIKQKWAGTAYKELLWNSLGQSSLFRSKTDMLLNNMYEVFNGQFLDGRNRPIISSLEYAREYLMKRTVTVLQTIAKSNGPLTPTATKLFQAINDEATECEA